MAEPASDVIDAPVARVDLFEDRATVCRRITFDEPGRRTVVLEGLSALIRERAVACTGAGLVVEDVTVERRMVEEKQADDARAAELADALEAAAHRLERHRAAHHRAGQQHERAVEARDAAREWTPRALAERDDHAAWFESLRAVEDAVVHAAVRVAEAARAVEVQSAEVDALRARLREARVGRSVLRARLVLQVLVEEPGVLTVRYTLPCALWRPMHRAELDGERLRWHVGAMAWNATGEDWSGVQLVCSTARPGDHASPPSLVDDVVSTRRRDREVVIEAREETISEARVGATVSASDVGVDDGGEARTFTAPAPVDLPSDGRPVRIALERWEDDATSVWLGHPERASEVVLRSTQRNRGTRPLLAGPVELVRDGIAVGRGEVGLVTPGEAFHLGWGSHDGLRVVRRRDHETERSRISGHQTHRFKVELKVTHLGDAPVRFTLAERLPVSEVKEVSVGRPSAEPALSTGPDPDGFCSWSLTLKPGAVERLTLTYTVEAPSRVRLPF